MENVPKIGRGRGIGIGIGWKKGQCNAIEKAQWIDVSWKRILETGSQVVYKHAACFGLKYFFYNSFCWCCWPLKDICRVNAGFHKKKNKQIILNKLHREAETNTKVCEKIMATINQHFHLRLLSSSFFKSHYIIITTTTKEICYRLFLHKEKRL